MTESAPCCRCVCRWLRVKSGRVQVGVELLRGGKIGAAYATEDGAICSVAAKQVEELTPDDALTVACDMSSIVIIMSRGKHLGNIEFM